MSILLTVTLWAAAAGPTGATALTPVADLPLPGGPSRFDYQWVDPASRRLYIAHLGADSLVVFDLDGQRVIREIPGLPGVHGVVAAPGEHLVFATATREKKLALIDDRTFEVRSRVAAGDYPNGLAYDPGSRRVFVSNNSGVSIGVVDAKGGRALPGIPLGGGAGNSQYDARSGHVLATIHGSPAIAEIDPATMQVVTRHLLDGVKTCHGLLVATEQRRAFAACGGDAPVLVVFDLGQGRQVQSLSLPPNVDVLAMDPGWRLLYAASSKGVAAVFAADADAVKELGRTYVGPNAHTAAVDPATHRVYFPLESLKGRPVLRVMRPPARPPSAAAPPLPPR
jgi:DNA-binding beta-propeller fold protein YncE